MNITVLEKRRTLSPQEQIEKMLLQFWDSGKIVSEEMMVTPQMAEYLLTINHNNRPISETTVERYAKDMANGLWSLNGEAIVISDEGTLNTGQHRALACIRADVSFPSLVVVGVKKEARHTDGQGLQKQTSHRLHMLGHSDGDLLSKSASMLMALHSGKINYSIRAKTIWGQGDMPSQLEVVEYAQQRQDIILHANKLYYSARFLDRRRIVALAVYLHDKGASWDKIELFLEKLLLGANLDANCPIFAVRRRLLNDTEKVTPAQFFELLLRTWNYWRAGMKATKSLPIVNKLPEVDP